MTNFIYLIIYAHYRQKESKFLYTVLPASQSGSVGKQHRLSQLSLPARSSLASSSGYRLPLFPALQ